VNTLTPFHLAIPVHDLTAARKFYGELLGCDEGRSADHWVDYNFFGHQLVCHLAPTSHAEGSNNAVDGHAVPIPHFGVVMEMSPWRRLRDRLQQAQIQFVIEPYIRFQGEAGEQATMFIKDPSGNALEFKAFGDIGAELFKK